MRDDSEKLRPNFHYEDSDPGRVKITTEGTCKAVYGVEQVCACVHVFVQRAHVRLCME